MRLITTLYDFRMYISIYKWEFVVVVFGGFFLQKSITCTTWITTTAVTHKSSNASFIKTENTFIKALQLLQ